MQDLANRGKAAMKRHGPQAARFGVVGAVCAVADFGLFAGFISLGAPPIAANIGSFLAANILGYVLNARFSFRSGEGPHALSIRGYLKFFTAYAASLVLSTFVVGVLAAPIGPLAAKLVASALGALLNYFVSAFVVFRRPVENGDADNPPESS